MSKFMIIFGIFSFSIVFASQIQNGRTYEKINNIWYQVENGKNYKIKGDIITVKFKESTLTSTKNNFNQTQGVTFLSSNTLGNSEYQYTPGNPKSYVYYKVRAVDYTDKESDETNYKRFIVNPSAQSISGLEENLDISQILPDNFEIKQNHPNPFNPETKISFGLPEQSNVSLKVYNIQGKEIATLAEGSKESGFYTATFNAIDLTSGVYIYRFTAKGLESGKRFSEIKRMLLIK